MTPSPGDGWLVIDARRRTVFLEKADTHWPDGVLRRLTRMSDEEAGIDVSLLRRACAAHGLPELPIAPASTRGSFHRLYDILEPGRPPRLLRVSVFAGAEAAARMALESRVIGGLRDAAVPVPRSTAREVPDGDTVRGTQLTDRAQGSPMRVLDNDERRTCAVLAQAARVLGTVHRLRGDGYGPLSVLPGRGMVGLHPSWDAYVRTRLSSHVQTCRMAGLLSDSEATVTVRHFGAVSAACDSCLLHGDPGGQNVLVQDGGVSALIDWEDALLGDPLFDVAALCCFHPERRHAVVFQALELDLTPGTDTWRRFWLYFLRIALARSVHRLRFGYPDTPGRPPASHRIQLALARLAGEHVAA